MQAPQTIPRSGTPDPATSFQALLSQGLSYCQRLAGDIWTDYNEHDPGVTILEQLCYALTDLSYRIDYEIPDILAAPNDAPHRTPAGDARPRNDTFYTGDRILSSSPITQNDYRNLLYDRVKGLKNAWLVPVTDHPLGVRGIYDVLVELREEIEDPEGPEASDVKREVLKQMRRTRNLGEDIGVVEILKPQPIRIEATVVIDPHADPANVLATVLFEIQNGMIPFPQVQMPGDLLGKMPPEDVWSGPMLHLGVLDQRSLRPIETTLHAQEIANIILKVRGVKRVKNLMVGNADGKMTSDSLPLEKRHVPRIDPPILKIQPGYTIQMELEGGFKSLPDARAVWSKIRELETAMRSNIAYATKSLSALSYLKVPTGIDRKIHDYYSIQHQFPAVYGLGKFGLANGLIETSKPWSEAESRARIRQLRAYLLVFEQLLADSLAQLANVPRLFSLDEDLDRSYFHQPLAHDPPLPGDPPAIVDVLLQGPPSPLDLVARYLVCVVDPRGEVVFTSGIQPDLTEAEEMRAQIAESGRSRGSYLSSTTAAGEVRLTLQGSNKAVLAHGLERFTSVKAAHEAAEHWVRFFVQIEHDPQQLENSIKLIPQEHFAFQVVDERSRIVIVGRPSGSVEERDRRIEEMLAYGIDSKYYRLLLRSQGEFEVGLLNQDGKPIAKGSEVFATRLDAEEGVEQLVALLRAMADQKSVRDRHLRLIPSVAHPSAGVLGAYNQGLAKLARKMDRNYLFRRNRFLDHLLARFAEQFDDQILERLDLRPYGEKDGFYEELIRWKVAFLREYVQQDIAHPASIGGGRARACDYSETHESGAHSDLSSSFERRIALLLGLRGHMTGEGYRLNPNEHASESGYFYMEEHSGRPPAKGAPDPANLHDNFVFTCEDASVSRLLLGSGTNPDYYSVKPTGQHYQILFHPPEAKQPIVIHHAPTRDEAGQRVASLIDYFHHIRSNPAEWYRGERMYLVEHLLLRPEEDAQETRLHLADENSQIHLTSVSVPKAEKEQHVDLILRFGQHKANYRTRTHPSGMLYLVLFAGEREIASGKQLFAEPAHGEKAKTELAALVRGLAARPKARDTILKTTVRDEFYSQRVSIFLPDWPMRFQNNEFKLYVEQIVCENAPAHLAVNCYWLSVSEMRDFEQLYVEWRKLKSAAALADEKPENSAQSTAVLNLQAEKLKAFIETLQARASEEQRAPAGPSPADRSHREEAHS